MGFIVVLAQAFLRKILFGVVVVGIVVAATSIPYAISSWSSEAEPASNGISTSTSANISKSALLEGLPAGVNLGAWQQGAPWDMSALTSFEDTLGKKLSIVMWYQAWGSESAPFYPEMVQTVADRGSIPMITWEAWDYKGGRDQPAYNTVNIAAGKYDAYVTSWAEDLKSYGKPVFLRYAHEMNGHVYPWSPGVNGNTTQSYVAAWRRVHDIFTRVGATNVLWVWSPNVKGEGSTPFVDVYPGDDYVDWMALDGYNAGTALPWGGWRTFSDLFAASYHDLTQLSQKPIMIAETAAVEQGGSKAAWITDAMLTQLPQNFPRIKALIWFNENWLDDQKRSADWRIESSPSSLAAFSQAAANPYYK